MKVSDRVDYELLEGLEPERITVKLAALLLAVDGSGWKVHSIPDGDFAPFTYRDETRPDDWGSWRRVHEWIDIEPSGAVLVARSAIQARLTGDIDSGRLYAIRVRRSEGGQLDPATTQLHYEDLAHWIEVNGVDTVDNWNQYWEDEHNVLNAVVEAAELARKRLRLGLPVNREVGEPPTAEEAYDQVIRLMAENADLRKRASDPTFDPTPARESQTPLRVIGAIVQLFSASSPGGQRYSNLASQAAVIDATLANFPNVRGLSKRTLETLFAKGKQALRKS